MKTKLVIIGGFLGAGKTTLIREVSQRVMAKGFRVGIITNDQAPGLVDTAFLSRPDASVLEISGSCFCCNFDGLMGAVSALEKGGAHVILAEPVGSCTDLSATILGPIRNMYPQIDLAPLTVLVDPTRVREVLGSTNSLMHPSALYIQRVQLGEADHILLNKIDTLHPDQKDLLIQALTQGFPDGRTTGLSAQNGEGIDTWLFSILEGKPPSGRIVDVDYDRYAEGEAVLGWLNATATAETNGDPIEWERFGLELLNRLHAAFQAYAEIGHIKLIAESEGKICTANLSRLEGEVAVCDNDQAVGWRASLVLNARVQMPPNELEGIVRSSLRESASVGMQINIQMLQSISPGRPRPTHRLR